MGAGAAGAGSDSLTNHLWVAFMQHECCRALAALQDKVCEADQVTVVAHPGEGGPPHDVHLYMQYDGRTVWAGVMNRPDRQFRLDEIAVALAEWRTRRGGSCPSVF